ncbi:MAG: peroxiredoxin [Rikenellaceae bacterium]|jgi:peroxiredoxin (alkyl hydroperoxide reductase subunit C)|nr:peroxiredoxin [Rikenellaceae bacterium]
MDNQEMNLMPRIGDKAPEFEANTTQGKISFPGDYKGKWAILFSHPADFTPVCTSEFITFGSLAKDFEELNCQLVGLSVDGNSSHIAWLRTIKERIDWKGHKGIDIQFPLIDDISMNVAKKYGMIQPAESETKAVRAVFYVDPKGIIRAIVYYPLSLGRNFDELKRVLIALQTADEFSVATPADWRPGDDVIVPAPGTMKAVSERVAKQAENGMKCYDWFFCTKPIAKEEIEKKVMKKG